MLTHLFRWTQIHAIFSHSLWRAAWCLRGSWCTHISGLQRRNTTTDATKYVFLTRPPLIVLTSGKSPPLLQLVQHRYIIHILLFASHPIL